MIREINVTTGEVTEREPTPEETVELIQQGLEAAWNAIRHQRNQLLAASDWTVLGDSPTPTAAWKTYRQQLRDLPANTDDPFNPVWPTPPS